MEIGKGDCILLIFLFLYSKFVHITISSSSNVGLNLKNFCCKITSKLLQPYLLSEVKQINYSNILKMFDVNMWKRNPI